MFERPVVLCILDGIGWGRRDEGDAFYLAQTPHLDRLMAAHPWCLLAAHGTAVGMPSDKDMGNSEVGHNAMGAGRVFDQGAKLVDQALASGRLFAGPMWPKLVASPTLHLMGLVSDGNVHSHVRHLHALLDRAEADGVQSLRLHVLTDGRDVAPQSALEWLVPLESRLAQTGRDWAIASGGGRMHITMDRYEADWAMVERGWRCHVGAEGRRFASASTAVRTMYAEDPKRSDQWLEAFVVGEYAGMAEGDGVLLFNFRGDRAIEISRAFDEGPEFDAQCFVREPRPQVRYAGMMEYDGDLRCPANFLVLPPSIDQTVGQILSREGARSYAVSETQKYGHVTYFFNGNNSAALPQEAREEVRSDVLPFDQAPDMKARQITDRAVAAIEAGTFDHIRFNLANGDMVGHTGVLPAVVQAVETTDECVGRIAAACAKAGAVLLITADHGNCDEMFKLNKARDGYARGPGGAPQPSTSHSLNPVPLILVDAAGAWTLAPPADPRPSIAAIGGTLLQLSGVPVPPDYVAPLAQPVLETR